MGCLKPKRRLVGALKSILEAIGLTRNLWITRVFLSTFCGDNFWAGVDMYKLWITSCG